MDNHSTHLTLPVRSRSSPSPSPSHSASASATSSIHKRKLVPDDHALPPFPSSLSDTRDGGLTTTSNDDLESISARGGAESDSDDDSDAVIDDEEDDDENDSMRTFTAARLENSNTRNTKRKTDSSTVKMGLETVKDGTAGGNAAAPGSVLGNIGKEDASKLSTENIQTSGAYSAREESLKREGGGQNS